MHDNIPVHRAEIIKQILDELQIQVMVWPPYSPDLNPIENLWALMKAIIYERYPELEKALDNNETLEKLIEAAKKRGMLLMSTSSFDVIRWIPPLTVSEEELAQAVEIFQASLEEVVSQQS